MGNTNSRRKRQASWWWQADALRSARRKKNNNQAYAEIADSCDAVEPDTAPMLLSNADDYVLYLNEDAGLRGSSRCGRRNVLIAKKVQLDFAGQFGGRLAMPDVLQALVCDHLNPTELRQLQHVSHGAHYFVQRRHRRLSRFRNPQHLGRLHTFEDLDAYQRLDLKLMRFYDRPVWQRCLIGAACVPIVPFVLLWHTPKVVKYAYVHAAKPAARVVTRRVLQPMWRGLVYAGAHWVVNPMIEGGCWCGRFTRDWIAVPLVQHVWYPGCHLVARSASSIYHHVIVPCAKGVQWTVRTLYNKAALPCARGVAHAASSVKTRGVHIGQWIWGALRPTGGALVWLAEAVVKGVDWSLCTLYDRVLVPLGRGLGWIWQNGIVPCGRGLYACASWCIRQVYAWMLRPIGRGIVFLWTRMVVPIVRALWSRIVWPILRTAWSVIRFVSEDIIWKVLASVGQLTHTFIVDWLYTLLLVPVSLLVWEWVMVPVGTLGSYIAQALFDCVSHVCAVLGAGCSIAASFVQALASAIATALGCAP